MRTKKQAFKDNLNFYHTFLQLNPPYPVLMDGSFILSIIANDVDDIGKYLKEHYDSTFNFFTTQCVQFDLECRFPNDDQISAIMEKVQVYEYSRPHSCIHSVCTSVGEIGKRNLLKRECGPPKHHQYVRSPDPRFIIAMQDGSLLETLREVAGIPLMYFDGGDLYLERPSNATLKWVSDIKFRNMELLELEREILQRALEDDDVLPRKDAKELGTDGCQKKKHTKGNQSLQKTEKTATKSNKSCEEIKKRRRDLSPDICNLPGLGRTKGMKKFELYRTLFWNFNQATSTVLQGHNSSYGDPFDIMTDSSTFEFGSEGEGGGNEVNSGRN